MVGTVYRTITHIGLASPRLARLACPLPPTDDSLARTRICSCSHARNLVWSAEADPQSPPEGVVTLRAGGHPRTHQTGLSCLISHTNTVCPRANTANSLWGSVTTRTRPNSNRTQVTRAERGMVGGLKKIRRLECLDCAGHGAQRHVPQRDGGETHSTTRGAQVSGCMQVAPCTCAGGFW